MGWSFQGPYGVFDRRLSKTSVGVAQARGNFVINRALSSAISLITFVGSFRECTGDESHGMFHRMMDAPNLLSLLGPFDGLPEESASCIRVRDAFDRWLPYAWVTAKWLWGLAVSLFVGAVVPGIVEDNSTLWKSCLMVFCIVVLSAVGASVFAYRFWTYYNAWGEQSHSGGNQGLPVDNIAVLA